LRHQQVQQNANASPARVPAAAPALCPLCDDDRTSTIFELDCRATNVSILRCIGCGVAFRDPPPAPTPVLRAAPESDEHADDAAEQSGLRPLAEAVRTRFRRTRARRIARGMVPGTALDVGCGQGRTLVNLRELGWQVQGVEVDARLAEKARSRGIAVHVGPLESHHFPDHHFDLVTFFRVFGELARPAHTLLEANRILRPGGRLIVGVPNFGRLQERLFGKSYMPVIESRQRVYFDENSLLRLLESTGFVPQDERRFSLEDSPLTWLQSAENMAFGNDNLLSNMLEGQPAPAGKGKLLRRFAALSAGVLLSPVAATASLIAAAAGHGDYLEIVATRR